METFDVRVVEKPQEEGDPIFALIFDQGFSGGIPTYLSDTSEDDIDPELIRCGALTEDNVTSEEIDLDEEPQPKDWSVDMSRAISCYLQPGQVAVLMETGAEKSRYVIGAACAVDSSGDEVFLTLNDIYATAAKKFGVSRDSITRAEY